MTEVTLEDVEFAREELDGVIHRTPLDRSRTFAELCGAASVGLKLETMQRTGSFKPRGAYNRMRKLSELRRENGVVTASAGNHAQGVALAGQELDIDVKVVVPEITPAAKIAATRDYGASVVIEGDIYERSYEHALEIADNENRTFVHPFDDPDVIAGQGTIGLELLEQYPELEVVVVPVGGGGLIGGIATALQAHTTDVRIVGVQPEGAAHAKTSLEKGEIHELNAVDTIADGIADLRMLETSFAVAHQRVDEVVTVTDADISVATALLAERTKVVAEPAGAAPLAALYSKGVDVESEHVALVISGGNVDLSTHADIVSSGLGYLGRKVQIRLGLDGWPSSLGTLVEAAQRMGGSIVDVRTERPSTVDHPNRQPITITLRGENQDHLTDILSELDNHDSIDVIEPIDLNSAQNISDKLLE